MVYGRRGSRVQPISTPPTTVRVVEPVSEECHSYRGSFVDQGSLDVEGQLEGHRPKKYSCRSLVTLLLKLWSYLRQHAHQLGVQFSVPETEDLFRLYSFRWQAPIMLNASLYIFLIATLLTVLILYCIQYQYELLTGVISINECIEDRHCKRLLIFFFATALPNLMLLAFFIVVIRSKRQNCFVTQLRLGAILATVLLTAACSHVFNNAASDYLSLIFIPMWLGMVMPLMQLVWVPVFAVGAALLLGMMATYAVVEQDLGIRLFSAFLIIVTHMVIHFCAVLLTLRHEREVFKAVEGATIYQMQSLMEDEKQERLLYSILPEHIALSIKNHLEQNALGGTSGKFRELYISSYDNVSILFADIKGFTAMASKCTAQQLVQTLNELYARFDIIAQKHHCIRIKLLGDCYYCVCGMPTPREDHADCCVKMGLKMMDVIKLVNEGMGTDLAMRVGVHSGKVLCGVIGLHKWQFDIWSDDVTLANTLESGGIPGFVHVSEEVHRLLGDEYDVIPSNRARTSNAIKEMGITTYLIQSKTPLTPIECPPSPFFSPSTSPFPSPFHGTSTNLLNPQVPSMYRKRRSGVSLLSSSQVAASVSSLEKSVPPSPSASSSAALVPPQITPVPAITLSPPDGIQPDHRSTTPPSTMHAMGLKKRAFSDEFKQQVDQATQEGMAFLRMNMHATETNALGDHMTTQEEPYSSDSEVLKALTEDKWKTMMMDALKEEVEKIGSWHTDSRFNKWTLQFKDMCAESEFLRKPNQHFIYYLVSLIIIHTLMYIIAQLIMPQRKHLHALYWTSLLLYLYLAVSFKSTSCTKFLQYSIFLETGRRIQQGRHWRHGTVFVTYILLYLTQSVPLTDCCHDCPLSLPLEGVSTVSARCDYSYMTLIILDIAITYISLPWTDLTLTSQLVLGIKGRVASFVVLSILFKDIFYNFFRTFQFPDLFAARTTMFLLITFHCLLSTASLVWVIMYWRQNQYKKRVQMLQEQASTTHRKLINFSQANTQSLLLNIIPSYVANYYLSKGVDSQDLFCQDHGDVAVMFASISGFDEFYGEDDINNHGLECLRLLNEIFSDFDELLANPQFQTVEKIKTIGATYMAAAGLTTNKATALEGKLILHQHLKDLVDLALVMMKSLDEINMESFQSFKLRIGIHHGPLVSGVIGAKKPQYDIWGDTVNTASRMESTGVPGKIQVAESTKEHLEFHGLNFEYRGAVKMKGKGEVKTYFVAKKK